MIWKKQPVGSKLSDLQNNKASKDTATQNAAGLMSAADKTKLDGVATGATAVSVVNDLNSDSTTSALSAAQGKALNSKLTDYISFTQDNIGNVNANISSISLVGRFIKGLHICFVDFNMIVSASIPHNGVLFDLPNTVNPPLMAVSAVLSAVNATSISSQASTTGNGSSRAIIAFGLIPAGNYIRGCLVFPTT